MRSKKKTVLIVGGSGFLGNNLRMKCLNKNFKVITLSSKASKLAYKATGSKHIIADISNQKVLNRKLNKIKVINYVVNFGGYIDHLNKTTTYKTHYVGCKNLANYFLKKKIKRFIQIGSSMEYGKKRSPQHEDYECIPLSTYGKAKYSATKYLLRLIKNKNFPAVIIRPYQVYGPFQNINRLIPIVINSCFKNLKFQCSSGKQYRDFLYVDDFIELTFLVLIKKKLSHFIYNVGFGKPLKVRNVIQKIHKIINKGEPIFNKIPLRKEESLITYPSIDRAKKFLKWKPKVSLARGIKKTINYYKYKN